jgi:UDP:flavonoid glycosyltransferase YjiC (YdhE family)
MAKVLILPLFAYGHITPTLPLAQELVARGEEVSYCLPEKYRPAVASTGAGFVPYQPSGRGFRWRPLSCEDLFFWQPLHMAVFSLEALPQLIEIMYEQQPDYLIYDISCLWGRLAARLMQLPAIGFHTTFVFNEYLGPIFWTLLQQAERASMPCLADAHSSGVEQQVTFRSVVEQLCSTYHLPLIELKSFFDHAERLNLVSIPPAFQPGVENFDDRFRFIGPTIVQRREATDLPLAQLKPQPTLYISLGTVCNHEMHFFKTCFAAFGKTGAATNRYRLLPRRGRNEEERAWQVILATGKSDPATLGTVPQNFVVRPYVPQLDVLQQTTVFLTHGGMNSIMEALYYGVPLVVIPQMTEQVITAKRVEELGLGIAVEKSSLTAKSLQEAVIHVAKNQEIHRRVHQMQGTFRQMEGARSAADAVLHFSRTDGQKGWSWPSQV